MQFASINGLALHVRVIGEVAARPVIAFANALGTDLRIWDAVAERLAGEFTLVLHDKRGHGLSDTGPLPGSLDAHVADLAGLLDHLGVARAVICGVSVGGMVAQGLWAARPDLVRGLILCDTAHRIGTAAAWNERIASVEAGRIEDLADPVLERWFPPAYRAANPVLVAGIRNMFVRSSAAGYIGTCMAVRDSDLGAAARSIAAPALCIAGTEDGSTPPDLVRSLADLVPGARFETIAGSGHLPCIDNPQALAGLIRGFAAGLE